MNTSFTFTDKNQVKRNTPLTSMRHVALKLMSCVRATSSPLIARATSTLPSLRRTDCSSSWLRANDLARYPSETKNRKKTRKENKTVLYVKGESLIIFHWYIAWSSYFLFYFLPLFSCPCRVRCVLGNLCTSSQIKGGGGIRPR